MDNFNQVLENLKEKFQDLKVKRATLLERIKTFTEEKNKIDIQLKEHSIQTEEELIAEITRIEKSVKEELEKCQQILK